MLERDQTQTYNQDSSYRVMNSANAAKNAYDKLHQTLDKGSGGSGDGGCVKIGAVGDVSSTSGDRRK